MMTMTTMIIRTYQELIKIPTFEDRFKYLKLSQSIGASSFGFDRIFNQMFYRSSEWRSMRDQIIVRDLGHDLAMKSDEYEVLGIIMVHHMNPIDINDIANKTDFLLNPDFLITTAEQTHRAIHYGDLETARKVQLVERTKNDTCPWKK